jgi:hypothetical protein
MSLILITYLVLGADSSAGKKMNMIFTPLSLAFDILTKCEIGALQLGDQGLPRRGRVPYSTKWILTGYTSAWNAATLV